MSLTGLLLIGHGTRHVAGRAEFAETVRQVAELLPEFKVQPAFLELAEPTIEQGVDRLVEAGIGDIVVQPLLLFAAGHAKQDIPAALNAAQRRYPDLRLWVADPLGCHPELLRLSAERFRTALAAAGSTCAAAPDATQLIVVGRGSSDADATAEVHRYACQLAELTGVGGWAVAFMAAAQPRLPEVLARVAAEDRRAVVVLPHLLFQGDVLAALRTQVAECGKSHPDTCWLTAAHLGPAPQLAATLAEVARLTKHRHSTN